MLDKIIDILSGYSECDKSEITRDSSLVVDLRLSSLDFLKIVMDLEEEFGIDFDEDEVAEITTVGDIEDCVKRLQED